jgi:hypothetical protein
MVGHVLLLDRLLEVPTAIAPRKRSSERRTQVPFVARTDPKVLTTPWCNGFTFAFSASEYLQREPVS